MKAFSDRLILIETVLNGVLDMSLSPKSQGLLYCLVFWLVLVNVTACQTDRPEAIQNDSMQDATSTNEAIWNSLSIPFVVTKFVPADQTLYAISSDGIAQISEDGKVRESREFTVFSKKIIAGKSEVTDPNQELSDQSLCEPEQGAIASGNLYVYALCEHSSQIWKTDLNTNAANLDLFHFTYEGDDEMAVYGPTGVSSTTNGIVFPAVTKSGPAMLNEEFDPLWKGSTDAKIVSMSMSGPHGWLVLTDGRVLQSADEGKKWKELSKVSNEAAGKVTAVRFFDSQNGIIAGDSLLLVTIDGGGTWRNETIGETALEGIVEISGNETFRVVWNNKGVMFGRDVEHKTWQQITVFAGTIYDVAIFKDRLFVIIDGKVYVNELPTN